MAGYRQTGNGGAPKYKQSRTPAACKQTGSARRAALLVACLLLALTLSACSSSPSSAYNRAISTFAAGNYADAATAFDKLGDYQQAATYAAYAHGLVLYDQGDFAAAEPYFEKTQDFMYGKQRYQYCHACVLEKAEKFDEAAEGYRALGEFEDAPARAAYCTARAAEAKEDYETALFDYADAGTYSDAPTRLDNLQTQVYDHAMELKTAKDYEQALQWFGLLGDYFDTQAQAMECKNFLRDQQYDQADAYENQGELKKAYDIFSGLSGYRDADTRANELAVKLGIAVEEDDTVPAE
ncbi:MAG TPA: hypothetical protein PLP25_08325 [Candidatus Limiplasma sp.]|nr:hypothetical protein [Candidatus Limiplasma sp.]HPS81846.1 hypothetical protein [Candidatus Limiplasma sp.]